MNASLHSSRLDYLDAVRAFALLLGIVFHASLSFMPMFIGWAVMDVSTSSFVASFVQVSHSFRMELFFLIAGFFSHLTFHRKGAGAFLKTRFVRIALPFVIGWFILRPLIISGWIMGSASLRGEVDIAASLSGGFASLSSLPAGIFTGSHLWFLYYLMLVTVALVGVRWLLGRFAMSWHERLGRAIDAVLSALARSGFAAWALAVPTAACLWRMTYWAMDTPDKSLTPHIPVTLIYGGFFAFGWALHRMPDLIAGFSRLSPVLWISAGLGVVATLTLAGFQSDPAHPHYVLAHVGFVAGYAVMMWSLVFLTIGVFKILFRKANPAIRYIADASYWLYLIHLPVVVWLQVAFAELPYHWSVKLMSISALTILVSLLLYDAFVRSTFVGETLNGSRKPRVLFRGRVAERQAGVAARP